MCRGSVIRLRSSVTQQSFILLTMVMAPGGDRSQPLPPTWQHPVAGFLSFTDVVGRCWMPYVCGPDHLDTASPCGLHFLATWQPSSQSKCPQKEQSRWHLYHLLCPSLRCSSVTSTVTYTSDGSHKTPACTEREDTRGPTSA